MNSSTPFPLARTYLSIARRGSRFVVANLLSGISIVLAIIGFSTQSTALEAISIIGLVTGGAAIAATFTSWLRQVSDLRVHYLPPLSAREVEDLTVSRRLRSAGYQVRPRTGLPSDALLTSQRVNLALFGGATTIVSARPAVFQFRPAPPVAHVLLREFTRKSPVLFNARKIRLASDVLVDDASNLLPVPVQPTHYFDTLSTNDSLPVRLVSHKSRLEVFSGHEICFPRQTIPSCEESACSNHFGASTLAVTADDYLVITEQGYRSNIARGQLMPSGSGSADWKDLESSADLQELVRRVAMRELLEECGLAPAEVAWLRIVGYGRLLARGGLPQFFCLARLNCSFGDIQVTRAERALTECHRPIDIRGPGSRSEAIQSAVKSLHRDGARLFSSLWWALELVAALPPDDIEAALGTAAPGSPAPPG